MKELDKLRKDPVGALDAKYKERMKSFVNGRMVTADYMYISNPGLIRAAKWVSRALPGEVLSGLSSISEMTSYEDVLERVMDTVGMRTWTPRNWLMHAFTWRETPSMRCSWSDIHIAMETPELYAMHQTRAQIRRSTLANLRGVLTSYFATASWYPGLYEKLRDNLDIHEDPHSTGYLYTRREKGALCTYCSSSIARIITRRLGHDVPAQDLGILQTKLQERREQRRLGIKKNKEQVKLFSGAKVVEMYKSFRNQGNLHSCMTLSSPYLDLYSKNPSKVRLAVSYKSKKPIGRALVWELDDGRTMLDRIYGSSEELERYATAQGWLRRCSSSLIWVTLDVSKVDNAPYMDTFQYGTVVDTNIIKVGPREVGKDFTLTSQSGSVGWTSSGGKTCTQCGCACAGNGTVMDGARVFQRIIVCTKCKEEYTSTCSACSKVVMKEDVMSKVVCKERILRGGYELKSTHTCGACTDSRSLTQLACGHWVEGDGPHGDKCGCCQEQDMLASAGPASHDDVHGRCADGSLMCSDESADSFNTTIMWSKVTCSSCLVRGASQRIRGAIKRKEQRGL